MANQTPAVLAAQESVQEARRARRNRRPWADGMEPLVTVSADGLVGTIIQDGTIRFRFGQDDNVVRFTAYNERGLIVHEATVSEALALIILPDYVAGVLQ